MTRQYPLGRVRRDSVAQPMRNEKLAELCAQIMERMVGDPVDVITRGKNHFYLIRSLSDGRMVRV